MKFKFGYGGLLLVGSVYLLYAVIAKIMADISYFTAEGFVLEYFYETLPLMVIGWVQMLIYLTVAIMLLIASIKRVSTKFFLITAGVWYVAQLVGVIALSIYKNTAYTTLPYSVIPLFIVATNIYCTKNKYSTPYIPLLSWCKAQIINILKKNRISMSE
mgnify:FL=1